MSAWTPQVIFSTEYSNVGARLDFSGASIFTGVVCSFLLHRVTKSIKLIYLVLLSLFACIVQMINAWVLKLTTIYVYGTSLFVTVDSYCRCI